MKKYFSFIITAFILQQSIIAQKSDPVIVSPVIGQKLDRVERNYFKLFPHFEGFEEAVFYMNPDSSLMVNIWYQTDEGLKDTVIERYRSVKNLQYHIDYAILHPLPPSRQARKGSFTTIILLDSNIVNGELIETGKYHLQVYNPEYKIPGTFDMGSSGFKRVNLNNIKEIGVQDKLNYAPIIFGAVGGITAFIIGLQEGQGSPYQGMVATLYSMIGLGIGYLVALVIPIEVESKTVVEPPFNENDIKGLRYKTKKY